MLIWLVALVAGAAAVIWTYGTRFASPRVMLAAALRGVAVAGAVALLLDAVAGRRRPAPPLVALDVSASWQRGRDSARFAQAVRRARDEGSGPLLLFGDSARTNDGTPRAEDRASWVRPAVERALAAGRPLVVVTDGELDDPEALPALSGGSRIVVLSDSLARDVALTELRVPRAAVAGDTLEVEIGLAAGARGGAPARVVMELAGRSVSALDVDSLGPFGERVARVRVPLPLRNGSLVLRAILSSAGDVEPRNDTLSTAVEVSPGAGAVLVSTTPDFDVRELAAVLRGTVSLPTRGFYRVAADVWREDGTLAAVAEDVVRRVAREAPLLILQGDTAVFGDPRPAARGSLLLVAPPLASTGEWYPTGTPASPMTPALSGSPWDSLPPLDVSPLAATADFEILETRRARRLERRVAAIGWERPRRVVLVTASGFWRWRFRGGVGAGVHAAFWGSVIDWLAAERSDVRAAVPVEGSIREGRPVRWRRGSPADSVVSVALTSEQSPAADTIVLRFPAGALFAESAPLPAGVYTATVRGGVSTLVVNPTAELLPRRPTATQGPVGAGRSLTDAPRLRALGWIFAIVIAALCAEWVLRRRMGLR
jgi:hypothetical protein